MASFLCAPLTTLAFPVHTSLTRGRASFKPMHLRNSSPIPFARDNLTSKRLSVITRAGPPSTSSYIFAFAFPLSMLIGTVIVSLRIADKLEKDYLEELAINQAIREADDEDEDDDDNGEDAEVSVEKEVQQQQPALQRTRTRNRPKREA